MVNISAKFDEEIHNGLVSIEIVKFESDWAKTVVCIVPTR